MKADKILPRSKYKEYLKKLDGKCAFCIQQKELEIKKFKHWTWSFSGFPYRKYHTLLISKRHITKFFELEPEELLELKTITKYIERRYRETGIFSDRSKVGNQLFSSWRSRYDDTMKKSVEHFHLHFYAKMEWEENELFGKYPHKINQDIFKK